MQNRAILTREIVGIDYHQGSRRTFLSYTSGYDPDLYAEEQLNSCACQGLTLCVNQNRKLRAAVFQI